MAARCCKKCFINYPSSFPMNDPCRVCDGNLLWDHGAKPDENWKEVVGLLVWKGADSDAPMYGGTTVMTRFERFLDSIEGADDFVLECGDRAPAGNE